MRRFSLNKRLSHDGLAPDEIEVVLIQFEHPDLEAPVRLSTDNSERLSTDPLTYGTRSDWRGADPMTEPFLWIVADALLPSDLEDQPAAAQVTLMNLDSRMIELLRSFRDPATVHMAVVMADTPDLVEAEWSGLQLTGFDADAGEISLQLSREEIEREMFPGARMSRSRFPGLHR